MLLLIYWPQRIFVGLNGSVGIHSDDEAITVLLARSRQVLYVPGVQKVKRPTGQADPVPRRPLIGNPSGKSLPIKNLSVRFGCQN
ncbi:MAG: hypothetical protein ACR2JB_26205 [Bryobacteraceae bacterium]